MRMHIVHSENQINTTITQFPCKYLVIYKKLAWEDQRRKQCYIFHVAPRGVNSAILLLFIIISLIGEKGRQSLIKPISIIIHIGISNYIKNI